MPHGPPICAVCGSLDGTREHHLVPRVLDRGILLTVWLCEACYGRVHGRRLSPRHRAPVGVGPDEVHLTAAAKANRAKAAAFAAPLVPVACELRDRGLSLRQIAAELTAHGVRAPRGGGQWTSTAVQRLLARAA